MKMTFDEYIKNPMGPGNRVMNQTIVYGELYKEKLGKILLREGKTLDYHLYTNSSKTQYYCYIKIPSEGLAGLYYDVVIKFFTSDSKVANSRTLSGYNVKFFSNDPSFVFTYAYSMKKNDMMVDELASIDKKAVTTEAKVTNNKNDIGYVKSIYFAYLVMKNYGLFDKLQYENSGEKFNAGSLISKIPNPDKILELTNKLKAENKKTSTPKAKSIPLPKKTSQTNDLSSKKSQNVKHITKTSKVKNTKTVGRAKRVKNVKKK